MRYYIAFFVLYEIIISFYFYTQYSNKLDAFHQNTLKLVEHAFNSTVNTFELANDNFHSQHSYEISKLVNIANEATTQKRDEVRAELLRSFMTFFSNKKLYSLEGMHIFDKNGHSLLRFHQPTKHDDPIVNLRSSLQNMLKDFSYKKGLEIGVYKESYRFQYPLFYDGEFVGSYEYSISFKALMKEMKKFYENQYIMLLKAQEIDAVASKETIQKRYLKVKTASQEFYFQSTLYQDGFEKERLAYLLNLKELSEVLNAKESKVIDYRFKGDNFNLVVKVIYDISGKHIGYMLVNMDNNNINSFRHELFINIFLASLLSLMAFLYLVRQIRNRTYVRELINLQQDMLVVTNGEKIRDTNEALLKFFGYKTLKEFEAEHSCICDFFIEEDGFLQKYNDGVIWTKYLLQYPDEKHKVKMRDISDNKIKVFELEHETFKSINNIFILFRDITDEFDKYNELMNRANYDSLTNIFNRSSFEHYLKMELERSSRDGGIFSLIMFDIDHFKLVNDEYGHDVGDVILKELSALVSEHIRDIDIFARWGGEEFMIISITNIAHSEAFAEKLRKVIEENEFTHIPNITCSFGVIQYHKGDTSETIVKRCDNMLYSAKKSGRNCVASMR